MMTGYLVSGDEFSCVFLSAINECSFNIYFKIKNKGTNVIT